MSDVENITGTVIQGVGLAMVAGVSMKAMKAIEKSISHSQRRSKKYKKIDPYNYWVK